MLVFQKCPEGWQQMPVESSYGVREMLVHFRASRHEAEIKRLWE